MKPVPLIITMEANEYGIAMLLFGGVIQAEQLAAAGIRGEELNEAVSWACRMAAKPVTESWPEFAEMLRKIAMVHVNARHPDTPPPSPHIPPSSSPETPPVTQTSDEESLRKMRVLAGRLAFRRIKEFTSPEQLCEWIVKAQAKLTPEQLKDFRIRAQLIPSIAIMSNDPDFIERYACMLCAQLLIETNDLDFDRVAHAPAISDEPKPKTKTPRKRGTHVIPET